MVKKLIYAMILLIAFSVLPVQVCICKYFTLAYWLPYTCGNQLELDSKQRELEQQVQHWNESRLVHHLVGNDFKKLLCQKKHQHFTKEINKIDQQIDELTPSIFSTGYFLKYTNGNQFEIDDLNQRKICLEL